MGVDVVQEDSLSVGITGFLADRRPHSQPDKHLNVGLPPEGALARSSSASRPKRLAIIYCNYATEFY